MTRKLRLFALLLPLLAFGWRWTAPLRYPAHFPAPVYPFAHNPLTRDGIALGRSLFYDPILSRDSTVSCASCHSSYAAFAHTDHALSHGIGDSIGTRNAPALFNLAWQRSFQWDGSVNHLDMQALAPVAHPREMGSDLAAVLERLRSSGRYPQLFRAAFGDPAITGERFLKALAQFELTLVSAGARYDAVREGKEQWTEQEANGYRLFKTHCDGCHHEPLFTNGGFADNGLPPDPKLDDHGREAVTGNAADRYQFKIPSLRNLAFTYPYMHDGRFTRLRDVVHHYTQGMVARGTRAPALQQAPKLSEDEISDLIAFLQTLNDRAFTRDPQYQFPHWLLPGTIRETINNPQKR